MLVTVITTADECRFFVFVLRTALCEDILCAFYLPFELARGRL
jgi:hypothetical protein